MNDHRAPWLRAFYYSLPAGISLLKKCHSTGKVSIQGHKSLYISAPKIILYQSSPKSCQLLCVAPHQPTAQLPAYLLNAPLGPEAPASSLSLDDLSVRVEPLREALVLTTLSSRAHLRVALILQHPVEALGLQATRVLVGGLAVTAGDLRQVSDLDLYLPDDFVGLESASTTKKGGRQR